MIIGDEYVIIRAVAGTLPDVLAGEHPLIIPSAYLRLKLGEAIFRPEATVLAEFGHHTPSPGEGDRSPAGWEHSPTGRSRPCSMPIPICSP